MHRLASCKGLAGAAGRRERDGRETLPPTDGAYKFVAAGDNEAVISQSVAFVISD